MRKVQSNEILGNFLRKPAQTGREQAALPSPGTFGLESVACVAAMGKHAVTVVRMNPHALCELFPRLHSDLN